MPESKRAKKKSDCGCPPPDDATVKAQESDPTGKERKRDQPERKFRRPLRTPSTVIRGRLHDPPRELTELIVARPGFVPARAVVPTEAVNPELLANVEKQLKDLPTLRIKGGEGAVDIKLEKPDGSQVKEGTIVLEGANANVIVPLDPTSRRFRKAGIAPGDYRVRAASASAGRAFQALTVREGDVTRSLIRLDGSKLEGTAKVRIALKGHPADTVHVRATDRESGQVVFQKAVKPQNQLIEIEVPFGRIHWDIDAGTEKSCYDSDVHDDFGILIPPHIVELIPVRDIDPNPPDWRFGRLGREFDGVVRFLPKIGIQSMQELAAAEPEALMHRAKNLRERDSTPIPSRLFGEAVTAARRNLGITRSKGESETILRLTQGGTFMTTLQPESPGDIEVDVQLGLGNEAELLVQGPSGQVRRLVKGNEKLKLTASPDDIAAKKRFNISLTSKASQSITGLLRTRTPFREHLPGFGIHVPTLEERIRHILEALQLQNPGLSVNIPPSVMAPENIQMWIDRARTLMAAAGVCSMNDLGRFRLNPMQVLRPGAYIAPVVQPPDPLRIPVLNRYAFAEVLQNTVIFYKPNDILHETAVVLAGAWDIRGQSIVIGQEVRELVVIVGSIQHDGGSRITWELPSLPNANAYWPNPAPRGANGNGPGANGQDGADGDQNPHPSKNGGANAVTDAPIITMYVLDATNNLPPIDLRGQDGGTGGRGQDGGRGGDGDCGRRADGTFFGGCCRGVGFGGDGGQGGDAGRGGKGGRGGEGGKLTLLTTAASITALDTAPPSIDVQPGNGGAGGPPGTPGQGGSGGPAGTADCETWCDEHPERVGNPGAGGAAGSDGVVGDSGPAVVEDAIQILPITEEQWLQEFNQPHILSVTPLDVEPGETVTVNGQNFDPTNDRVFFDGVNVGPVSSGTQATFTVPLDSDGGYHPIVIRPAGTTDRRSNRFMLRVIPKLDDLPDQPRWVENQAVTLTGLAFVPGLQVLAEDRSTAGTPSFALPVIGVTRTSIAIQVPGGFLGALRGVRRIVVRNPDGAASGDERVIRISDTIVVRVAAFRVVGTTPGVGTTRTDAEIAALFNEGGLFSVAGPWQQARIVFRLVQPVGTVSTTDDNANVWPIIDTPTDQNLFNAAPGVLGALNVFFARDVEVATAYAYFGGGPIFIGDEGGPLGPVDFQQVVAHEIGHALCLRHICDGSGEGPGTFFNRDCDGGDDAFLMYPFWDTSDGMTIHSGQVDPARTLATHFEDGKTQSLPAGSLFMLTNATPQCGAVDTQN